MDRGSLLESGSGASPITTGVKLSTYFALLIRPYHYANSPLLRELFALAQSIDLLRWASCPNGRRVSVPFHRCSYSADGRKLVDSKSTRTVPLGTRPKHVHVDHVEGPEAPSSSAQESGYSMGGRGWTGPSKGKGQGAYEKGKKGDNKGKGRGKGKNQSKEGWPSKAKRTPGGRTRRSRGEGLAVRAALVSPAIDDADMTARAGVVRALAI